MPILVPLAASFSNEMSVAGGQISTSHLGVLPFLASLRAKAETSFFEALEPFIFQLPATSGLIRLPLFSGIMLPCPGQIPLYTGPFTREKAQRQQTCPTPRPHLSCRHFHFPGKPG